MEELGGNPNVVICEPEIKSFKIQEEHDFIVLACKKNNKKKKNFF
jgi:protein phosphatase PTC2/3